MSSCTCCQSPSNEKNVACMLYAFSSEQRMRYSELRAELMSDLTTQELDCGFSFKFPNKPLSLQKIAEWVAFENQCCPFIKFTIFVDGDAECIRVELTGNETVKNLIRQEFSIQ